MICGDYNILEVSWGNDDSGLTYSFTSTAYVPRVPEAFSINGFFQVNSTRNSHISILDLIFSSSSKILVKKSFEPVVSADPFPPPLNISFRFSLPTTSFNRGHYFFNFLNAYCINIR